MQNKLKYRRDLKRPLTSGEVDDNFEFLAQAVSGAQFGIKNVILPNSPAPIESGQYPVKEIGVYTNFKDSNGQSISVTEDDFKDGIVYIIYNGTYSYKFIAPIPLDGEVEEGDMRGINGDKIYDYIRISSFNKFTSKDFIQGKAITTSGYVLDVSIDQGAVSVVDKILLKDKKYVLKGFTPSVNKTIALVNDTGQVLVLGQLENSFFEFETTQEFYKLRVYIQLIKTQEPSYEYLKEVVLMLDVYKSNYVQNINEMPIAATGYGGVDIENNFSPSGIEIFKSTLLSNLLSFNMREDMVLTDFSEYIVEDMALTTTGENVSYNAKGYMIVDKYPIELGVCKLNLNGVQDVDVSKTKVISQYDIFKRHLGTVSQVNGANSIDLNSNCAFVSFTIKTPTDIKYNIYLYINSIRESINAYNGIPFKSSKSLSKYFKGISLGDSITWYDGKPFNSNNTSAGIIAKGYQSYIRDYFSCDFLNEGRSGWDIREILQVVKSQDYKLFDFATLTSGANDARKGVPIGELKEVFSNFDITTFYGAFQSAVEFIIKNNPEIRLFLITPIKGWFNENGTSDVPSQNYDIPNIYPKAIVDIANLYSLPYCDWYNFSRINKINRPLFIGDNEDLPYYLHPNNEGYKMMSEELIKVMSR